MHDSALHWCRVVVDVLGLAERNTLEVGAFDVNGTARQFFTGPYTGLDLTRGPGVDVVADAEDMPFDPETFEVVICTQMLEHSRRPWKAVAEMCRVLRPKGVLMLTAAGFESGHCVPHYPPDYWRFSKAGMAGLLEDGGVTVASVREDDGDTPGVLCVGVKPWT